jgi:hypothetical protein
MLREEIMKMKLESTIVIHKTFGIGKVIRVAGNNVTVLFDLGEKNFIYPDAFEKYLTTDDSSAGRIIDSDIEARKNEIAQRLLEEAKERQKSRQFEKENTRIRKKSKSYVSSKQEVRSNIAFKCNFCDGGATKDNIGFRGICSYENMRNNIAVKKRPWCSHKDSPCNHYITRKIFGEVLNSYMNGNPEDIGVCYESRMLINWSAHAGVAHSGQKEDTPFLIKGVENNSLAVLTTRLPQKDTEQNRIIFAVFLVDESYEGDDWDAGYVTTRSKYKIALKPEEAVKVLFWNYYSNKGNTSLPMWGTGLFRYFDDIMAIQILKDIAEIKKGGPDEDLAKEFLTHFCYVTSIDPTTIPLAAGALMKQR